MIKNFSLSGFALLQCVLILALFVGMLLAQGVPEDRATGAEPQVQDTL